MSTVNRFAKSYYNLAVAQIKPVILVNEVEFILKEPPNKGHSTFDLSIKGKF